MRENTFYLVSLGCSKNTVDSESITSILISAGYQVVQTPSEAEILIVNTCGFIQSAREESLDTLAELANRKKKKQILVAAGCMSELHRNEIAQSIRGIDGIIGTRRWMDMVAFIKKLRSNRSPKPYFYEYGSIDLIGEEPDVQRYSIQGSSAYIKIADGCRRPCAFCSIPLIKGSLKSRPIEAVLKEAAHLQSIGIQEINLIAQDTTDYGHDLGIQEGLSTLLDQLVVMVPYIPWIRILYAYPGYVTDRLIDLMASQPQILPYLDLPLQHADPDVLKKMNRPSNIDWVYKTIDKMRNKIPNLSLRTTFIVGFPGETDQSFQKLLDFTKELQFDRVGAFTYSFEKGTPAEPLGDPISDNVKEQRLEQLMLQQENISLSKNQSFVGKTLPVLIEGIDPEQDISIGRTYRDAPEVDGLVVVYGKIPIGKIIPVTINEAMVHDLAGYPAKTNVK